MAGEGALWVAVLLVLAALYGWRTDSLDVGSVAPCGTPAQSDFYLHVNEKWMNDPANAIPAEYTSWGSFTVLHDRSLHNQIGVLEEIVEKGATNEDEKKMAKLWDVSMSTFALWDAEGDKEVHDLSRYQAISQQLIQLSELLPISPKEGDRVLYLAHTLAWITKSQIGGPFDIGSTADKGRSDDMILFLAPTGLSLSQHYYAKEEFKDKLAKFKDHLNDVSELLSSAGVPLASNFADLVFQFECDLAALRMTQAQSRLHDKYFTNSRIDSFAQEIDTLRSLPEKLDNYPEDQREVPAYSEEEKKTLSMFMETFLGDLSIPTTLEQNFLASYTAEEQLQRDSKRLCVYDGDYFRRVFRLLFSPEKSDALRAYLQYRIISDSQNFCTRALNELFFEFYSRTLFDQKEQKPYKKRAIARINAQ